LPIEKKELLSLVFLEVEDGYGDVPHVYDAVAVHICVGVPDVCLL
jgi:hypothetical protein